MAGEDSHPSATADDPCPLCGAAPAPARVTLAKRRLFAADSSMTTTTTAAAADEASARHVAGLHAELEAERAAAADAACEAMSMILRLQRDKSEAMMEARQYRRYAEERFAHDAAEAYALRAAVALRDAAVRALAARLRDCQARLLHLGYDPPSPRAIQDHHHHHHAFTATDDDDDGNYPPIQCLDHPAPADVGTPRTHHLLNRTPGAEPDPPVCGSSPRHARTPSGDTFPHHPLDSTADRGAPDEETDRVYTVDAVHGAPASCWDDDEEAEIQKLKARLHALEADRESMRRTIVSMGDDKLLLREVAHQLCKQGAVPVTPQPAVLAQRRLVKRRPAGFVKLFIATVIKVNICASSSIVNVDYTTND
jgi:hypothetical protein